jgi:hypothetical protein
MEGSAEEAGEERVAGVGGREAVSAPEWWVVEVEEGLRREREREWVARPGAARRWVGGLLWFGGVGVWEAVSAPDWWVVVVVVGLR